MFYFSDNDKAIISAKNAARDLEEMDNPNPSAAKKPERNKKPDGTYQYSVSCCTEFPLATVFTPEVSNYSTAFLQAKTMFNKLMSTSEGKEAVATMVQRGKDDHHFKG